MNTTEDYQLETLRARFAARGYQSLNRHRSVTPSQWIGFGLLAAAATVFAAATFIFLSL